MSRPPTSKEPSFLSPSPLPLIKTNNFHSSHASVFRLPVFSQSASLSFYILLPFTFFIDDTAWIQNIFSAKQECILPFSVARLTVIWSAFTFIAKCLVHFVDVFPYSHLSPSLSPLTPLCTAPVTEAVTMADKLIMNGLALFVRVCV